LQQQAAGRWALPSRYWAFGVDGIWHRNVKKYVFDSHPRTKKQMAGFHYVGRNQLTFRQLCTQATWHRFQGQSLLTQSWQNSA
jgi:hypothetical protein